MSAFDVHAEFEYENNNNNNNNMMKLLTGCNMVDGKELDYEQSDPGNPWKSVSLIFDKLQSKYEMCC